MRHSSQNKRRLAIAFSVLAVGGLSLAAVALADNTVADGDDVTPVGDNDMAFGAVDCGEAANKNALIAIVRQGAAAGTNTFQNNANVTVTVLSITQDPDDPGALSASMGSPNTITLPENWTTIGNGTLSSAVSSTVTVNPNVEGPQTGAVTYRATGRNTSGSTITRDDTMNVTWNTGTCSTPDTTPPEISYNLTPSSPDGNNGWYKSNVSLEWTVTEDESPSSLVKDGCVDQNITADQDETEYSCSAISDGGSADPETVKVKRDATPPHVSVTGVSDGATYTLGSVPDADCDTQDATSGVETPASLQPLSGGPVGSVTATCSGAEDKAGNAADPVSATYSVVYDFDGFFRPVDNNGVFNVAKAGSGIPVKFDLDGYQGLNILAAGSPGSKAIYCNSAAGYDAVEETDTAGNSSLTYDAVADQYVYVWKTDKKWANTCRQLSVELNDGTIHTANFKFPK